MASIIKFIGLNSISRLLNWIAVAFLAKILAVELFATYTLYMVALGAFVSVLATGLVASLTRDFTMAPSSKRKTQQFSYYFISSLIMLSVALAAIYFLRSYLSFGRILNELLPFLLASIIFSLLKAYVEALLLSSGLTTLLGLCKITETLSFLTAVFMYANAMHSETIYKLYITGQAMFFAPIFFIRWNVRLRAAWFFLLKIEDIKQILKKLTSLSLSALVAAPILPLIITWQIDQLNDSNSVANFGIGNQFQAAALFLPSLFSVFLTGKIMKKDTSFSKDLGHQVLLAVCSCVVIVSGVFVFESDISAFYNQYTDVKITIYIMCAVSLFHSICNITNNYIIKYKKESYYLVLNIYWAICLLCCFAISTKLSINNGLPVSLLVAYASTALIRLYLVVYFLPRRS